MNLFKPNYQVRAGIYAWDVYKRNWYSPFYQMFPVKSFQCKRDAEQWIKEQG